MSAVPPVGVTVYGCAPDEAALFRLLGPARGVAPSLVPAELSPDALDRTTGHRCASVTHRCRVDADLLRALHRAGVRHLVTRSAGVDHVDLAAASRLGITVGTATYSPDSVADHTLMTMLMVLRDTKAVLRRVDVHDYRLPAARGRELRGLTVGVVGTGRIGSAVVARLDAFGCRVLTHDRRGAGPGERVGLETLLRHSDVVTLHLPLDAGTHHLIDRRRIARMRPGAVLVNTARGGLVDTAALVDALAAGHLGGAALDVLEGEDGVFYADHRGRPVDPLLARLHALPNAVLTPHTAYFTGRALRDTVESTLLSCLTFERETHHA